MIFYSKKHEDGSRIVVLQIDLSQELSIQYSMNDCSESIIFFGFFGLFNGNVQVNRQGLDFFVLF